MTAGPRRSARYRQALTLATIIGLVAALAAVMRPTLARAAVGDISTIAGTGIRGYTGDGGPATSAELGGGTDALQDPAGNVFIADLGNHVVRKVDTSGVITTVAGNGTSGFSGDGGPATKAQLDQPLSLSLDSAGNLYIADQGSPNRIRKVDPSGTITTFAGSGSGGPFGDGGPATSAGFNPQFMVITPAGLFLTDYNNNNVRKIDSSGIISTFASGINNPEGVTADPAGNLYVAAYSGNQVDKIDTAGNVTVVAGTGSAGYGGDGGAATAATINGPYGLAYAGGSLYIADSNNFVIRKIDPFGVITTVAGNGSRGYSGDGGPATSAQLNVMGGLHFTTAGDLLIGDFQNYAVRKVAGLAFDLLSLAASAPTSVAAGQSYAYTFTVNNPGSVGPATGVTLSDTLPAGLSFVSATASQGTCSAPGGVVTCSLGTLVQGATATVTITVTAPTTNATLSNTAMVSANQTDPAPADDSATAVTFVNAADLTVTAAASPSPATSGAPLTYTLNVQNAGPYAATGVVVSDTLTAGPTFQSVSSSQGSCSQSSGVVTCSLGTVSAGGTATVTVGVLPGPALPQLTDVASVTATNPDPNPANNTATVQTVVSGAFHIITGFAGNSLGNGGFSGDGGPATSASLNIPVGIAVDVAGNAYIADALNNAIRKVDPFGTITRFAGTGTAGYSGDGAAATAAVLNQPTGVTIDAAGNVLIADSGNNVVRKVNTSGVISTVAGTGAAGYSGDGAAATAAHLNSENSVLALGAGGFLIADTGNNVVRKVDTFGTIRTIVGNGTAGYTGDGGAATSAELNAPFSLAVDPAGDVFIAELGNSVVRKVDSSATISTFAGTGTAGFSGDGGTATSAQFNHTAGLAYSDGYLFVSDYSNNRVRQIDPSGTITSVVGNGSYGTGGDGGPGVLASLEHPQGLAIDAAANLLIAGNLENRVREVSTIAPDLLHLSQAAPQTVASGSSYSISLAVANPGPVGAATGVTVSDTLPAGLALGSAGASSSQGTCNVTLSTVTCAIGQLAPLSLATVTLNVTAPGSSVALTNTAKVTANEVDPALGDNAASATTYVDAADLSVTGAASPDPVLAGRVQTLALSVQNAGPTAATGVNVTNPLPSGVTLQSASASQGSCTLSGQTVNCSLGTLGVGGSATVTLGLVPSANVAGITDTPTVSGNQVDQNPANNTVTIQTTVVIGVATQFTNPGNTPTIPGQELPFAAGITGGADGNIWYARLFPNNGEYQSQIGRVTKKGVYQPAYTADQSFVQDMIQAPDGNVWFSETAFSGDPGGQSVGRITPDGKVTLFPMCGSINCSGGALAVGPDGNIWFTTDKGGFGLGRIDIKTGAMAFFPTAGTLAIDLSAGTDGNVWYTTGGNFVGRMTPSGVNTFFTVPDPNYCGNGSLATGRDHLLWLGDGCGNDVVALNVTGGQLNVVSQFGAGTSIVDIEAGPDAVYFGMPGSGPVTIGRATTAGLLFYSTGTAGFVGRLTAGPDGNIWFTDSDSNGNPGIGHVTPPPSGTTGAPVIGHLNPTSTHANKTPAPKVPTRSNTRPPSPPPVSGPTQCPDNFTIPSMSATNPAQGTVFNGDVIVNDNGSGCILPQVTINGNLHVTAGAFADLSFSTVNGSVIVDTGGQVHIVGSHVTGSVTGTGDSFITVFNSKVGVDLTSNPGQYGVAMVCGTTVGRNLTDSGATDTTFPSVIGDPTGPIPCDANSIGGTLTLSGNSEQILVHGNKVAGAIVVTNNPSTAAFDIRNNNAASLSCSGNAVAPTGAGNRGAKSGQCAKL